MSNSLEASAHRIDGLGQGPIIQDGAGAAG